MWKQRGIHNIDGSLFLKTDYNRAYQSQNGRCKICLTAYPSTKLGADHDHKTGFFRGLLCGPCNHLLGNSKDNQELLLRAIYYLGGKL